MTPAIDPSHFSSDRWMTQVLPMDPVIDRVSCLPTGVENSTLSRAPEWLLSGLSPTQEVGRHVEMLTHPWSLIEVLEVAGRLLELDEGTNKNDVFFRQNLD